MVPESGHLSSEPLSDVGTLRSLTFRNHAEESLCRFGDFPFPLGSPPIPPSRSLLPRAPCGHSPTFPLALREVRVAHRSAGPMLAVSQAQGQTEARVTGPKHLKIINQATNC